MPREIELRVPEVLTATGHGKVAFTVELTGNDLAGWQRTCRVEGHAGGERPFHSTGSAALEIPGDIIGKVLLSLSFVDPHSRRRLVGHCELPVQQTNEVAIHISASDTSVVYQPIDDLSSGVVRIPDRDRSVRVTLLDEPWHPAIPLREWIAADQLYFVQKGRRSAQPELRVVSLHFGASAVVGRCFASQLHDKSLQRLRGEDEDRVHWVTAWDDPGTNQISARLRFQPTDDVGRLEVLNLTDYSHTPQTLILSGSDQDDDDPLAAGRQRFFDLVPGRPLHLESGDWTRRRSLVRFCFEEVAVGGVSCALFRTAGTNFVFPPDDAPEATQTVHYLGVWIPMQEKNLASLLATLDGEALNIRFPREEVYLALRFAPEHGEVVVSCNEHLSSNLER